MISMNRRADVKKKVSKVTANFIVDVQGKMQAEQEQQVHMGLLGRIFGTNMGLLGRIFGTKCLCPLKLSRNRVS